MNDERKNPLERIDALYARLDREAEGSGYHLNPDREFTRDLMDGLLTNIDRYGYMACPCRLAEGEKPLDLDIICPCDYRDPDLLDWGACYCALYVEAAVKCGQKKLVGPIPERRLPAEMRRNSPQERAAMPTALSQPVHRCRVCGYLCARERPPEVCPICKATKERFERFM